MAKKEVGWNDARQSDSFPHLLQALNSVSSCLIMEPLTKPLTPREKFGPPLARQAIGSTEEAIRGRSVGRQISPASISDSPKKPLTPPLLSEQEKPNWLKNAPVEKPVINQPAISAPVAPAGMVAPPSVPDAFYEKIKASIPAAEKKYGFNMSTGQLAPTPAKPSGAAGQTGMQGPPAGADKFAAGMRSITEYNKRMATPAREKPTTPFGMGMNGEAPALSKPFGSGMTGGAPIVARTLPGAVPAAPQSPYESKMAGMLQTDQAGIAQPASAEPAPAPPVQDPFYAKLEGSLKGARIKPAGRRGAKRGATVKGGQFHGQLLDDVIQRIRNGQ